MNELLGSRIKALRSAKHFTQEEVAEQIGISRQKYARIESGANSITLEVLSKIAAFLDVTVGDITRVLDEAPVVAYRAGSKEDSSRKMFDMLDLFYANKHLYTKMQQDDDCYGRSLCRTIGEERSELKRMVSGRSARLAAMGS